MPRLRKLTKEEHEAIKKRAQEIVYDDCKQDNSYLRSVVDDRVENLDTEGRLDAISNDPDLVFELLGFNPYEEE